MFLNILSHLFPSVFSCIDQQDATNLHHLQLQMIVELLIIAATCHATWGNNITVCDCGRAEVIGLMDVQLPSYCDSKITSDRAVMEDYNFFVTEEPHRRWSADMCMTWRKERTTTGYFFGAFDTIDSMSTSVTTTEECKQLVNSHMCDGNKMNEISKNSYEYKGSPKEKGTWMQKITETKKNCATKKITLHRDCLTCPVMSPFGVLTNKTDVTSVVSRDVTIIWDIPFLQQDEKCKLKKVISAWGTRTKGDDGSYKLVDESNQLEFHFEEETFNFCNHTFHKLANLRNAYIEFPKIAKKQGMFLFNRQHKMCLDYTTLELAQCLPVDSQWFKVSKTLVVQTFRDASHCMGFIKHELRRTDKYCEMDKMPKKGDLVLKDYKPDITPLVWNPETKILTDGVFCLEAYRDKRVEAVNCSAEKTNQQWTIEPERNKIIDKTEEVGPLLAQHHQFIEDKALERGNALLREIKEIYCGNLLHRRYTTQLLAENNGIQAAIANNLPRCSRLKPNGVHLLVQQCKEMNVTVRGEKTKCGYEPRFGSYTIGRDGYSLHPFQECFWKDQVINLNGRSYSWNETTENFTLVHPTYHLATINLQEKFPDIDDNELEYQFLHHKAYETSEFEQQNVLNELITQLHVEEGDSISELTLNKHAESRFWSLSNWTTSLKTSLISATVIVPLVALACLALCYFRLKQIKHQKELTEFALQLQRNRAVEGV